MAEQWKEQRERVEDDVGLAILGEGLDLGRWHPRAADPDGAFHYNRSDKGAESDGREHGGGVVRAVAGQEFGDGFLEDLEEGDDHEDEKARMPRGSRQRRPTGNLWRRRRMRQRTRELVA